MDQKAVSQKPDKDKRKHQHKRRSKRTLTHAVTHIRLIEANPGKLEALDRLVMVYLALCQHYVTHFCTEADPNSYAVPVYATDLSERWHRVAIQQAAGIARAFRTNRQNAYDAYLEDLTDYAEAQAKATASGVPLTRKSRNPSGVNGTCQNYASQPFKPMPTWWFLNHLKTRRSTTGYASPPWRKGIPSASLSNSPLITAKPSPDVPSTPQPLCTNARGPGGVPSPSRRTFLFKRSHEPLAWALMWGSPTFSRPRRESSTDPFMANSPSATSAIERNAVARR